MALQRNLVTLEVRSGREILLGRIEGGREKVKKDIRLAVEVANSTKTDIIESSNSEKIL